ncbi:MAG TPA: hypothetical protein VFQ61_19210 [Polyangiaceae bacterium]|nr:hypothetical protein [Polyangiaceae bacterium]
MAILAFGALFAALYCGVMAMLASMSGWSRLAERYPANRRFKGPSRSGVALQLEYGAYRGVCRVGSDHSELNISLPLLFRFRHPTLSIPWAEIVSCRPGEFFGTRTAVLRTRAVPEVPIAIPEELAKWLESVSPLASCPGRTEGKGRT